MDDLRCDKDESSSLMLSNVWLSMPSSGRSAPKAPSALLSEGQRPPSSAARRLGRSGVYALAASFLFRLPTVRLLPGREVEDGMKWRSPHKALSLSTPLGTRSGPGPGMAYLRSASQQPWEEGNRLQMRTHQLGSDGAGIPAYECPALKHMFFIFRISAGHKSRGRGPAYTALPLIWTRVAT